MSRISHRSGFYRFVTLGLASCLLVAFPALAGDIVIINRTVTVGSGTEVSGNGNQPNGTRSTTSDPNNNSVTLDQNARVNGNVTGGWTHSGTVSGNRVLINNSRVDGQVYGGWIYDATGTTGSTDYNVVEINGQSTIAGSIYGGFNNGGGLVRNNQVTISGGNITGTDRFISGGYNGISGSAANVSGNSVTITGGTMRGAEVSGGRGQGNGAYITDNTVNISGGVIKNVYGGRGNNSGRSTIITDNRVSISGGEILTDVAGGYTEGSGNVTGNTVNISGGTVGRDVYGGHGGTGDVTGNTVNISGGTVSGDVYGGYNTDTDAHDNTVTLSNATVGGYVRGANPYLDWESSGNKLFVTGGQSSVGGIQFFQSVTINSGASVNVTNTTSILGDAFAATIFDLTNNGFLSFYNGQADYYETLFVEGAYSGTGMIGLDVLLGPGNDIADKIAFTYPPDVPLNLAFNPLPGSVARASTGTCLNGDMEGCVLVATVVESKGHALKSQNVGIYNYELVSGDLPPEYTDDPTDICNTSNCDAYYLRTKLVLPNAQEYAKVYSQAGSASLLAAILASDNLLRESLNNAVVNTAGRGLGLTADIGYSSQRTRTGSHIDLKGVSASLVLAYNSGSAVSFGAFGELFDGEYETADRIPDGRVSRSRGDTQNYGGGLFIQYRPGNVRPGNKGFTQWTLGPHLEATVRAGESKSDFRGINVMESSFEKTGTTYYGAALGGGYVFQVAPRFSLDAYAHTHWTRLEGRKVRDSLGQNLDFRKIDSLRVISGFRAEYEWRDDIRPYAGLAVDWETDGKADSYVDGVRANPVEIKGVSGLVDLGIIVRARKNVFLNFKGVGSFGRRDGLGGMVSVRAEF